MNDYIDAAMLKSMFYAGTQYLEQKKDLINELNVFPVPDGDTGTNMLLTLMAAVKELDSLPDDATMDQIGARISAGTLRGARGNSGVIMSQLCRGFFQSVKGSEFLGNVQIARALAGASEAAYRAVVSPKEGTILTIARETAEKAVQIADSAQMQLSTLLDYLIDQAEETLIRTPQMLPVLKEAGVVDSGGQGLLEFLKGARDAFSGKTGETLFSWDRQAAPQPVIVDTSRIETADIHYIYCTEFIIECRAEQDFSEEALRNYLMSIGDSVVCVSMDGLVKVHVHTNHPGQVIEAGLRLGELSSLKIDNMKIEHHERVIHEEEQKKAYGAPSKETGFVAVCTGRGIREVFQGFHVDAVIEGGQTMNPSTQDILKSIYDTDAQTVFVLPNNSNILLAARQAAGLCRDRDVIVVPSRNICEGIGAMISYVPSASAQENLEIMTGACQSVKCGEVTVAIRDAQYSDITIHKDEYMGIGEGKVLTVSSDMKQAAVDLILALAGEDAEFITIYYGEGQSSEDAEAVMEQVLKALPDIDVEVTFGGQAVYYYIVSVE